MYQPKFEIILQKESFYPDKFICQGNQLIQIVSFLRDFIKPHFWYSANVRTLGEFSANGVRNSFALNKIGTDYELTQACRKVDQFLSGVFLAIAIDKDVDNDSFENLEIDTEDEPFRPLPIEGVLIEIRTFDTSFFEIYSEKEKYLEKISKKFHSNIIKSNFTTPT